MEKNTLLNLISHLPDIDRLYLYAKDLYEVKCQLLINKCEGVGLKHYNDFKDFTELIWMTFMKILKDKIQQGK